MAPIFSLVRRSVLATLLVLACGVSPAASAEEPVDLFGTWFVLIHYRDSSTANADSDRWEDKVWRIEKKGSRLQWAEYPIVVFNDGSGRFGRVGRNPRARLLHKWEPNDGQMEEIRAGLQVNSRGSKTKTLRGSPKRGYKSLNASRSTSALTVGYQETWSIDDPTGLPVFTRDDALGTEASLASNSSDVVSGRTRYQTLQVLEGGNVLQGTYTRDENKKGTFRLIRGGDARGIESDGRTPNQKQQQRFQEAIASGMEDTAYADFQKSLGDDVVRDLRRQIGEEKITELWTRYSKRVIAGDKRAKLELIDAIGEAYLDSVQVDLRKALAEGDGDVLLSGSDRKIDPDRRAMMENIRKIVGEQRIAELAAKYGSPVRAGDAAAQEALARDVRTAYEDALREAFVKRLEQGELEALEQYREMQRRAQDRR